MSIGPWTWLWFIEGTLFENTGIRTKVTSSAFTIVLYGNMITCEKMPITMSVIAEEVIGTSKEEKMNSGAIRGGYHVFSSIENWILKKRTYHHLLRSLLLLYCCYCPLLLSESRAPPSRPQSMVSEGLAWALSGEVPLLFQWCWAEYQSCYLLRPSGRGLRKAHLGPQLVVFDD